MLTLAPRAPANISISFARLGLRAGLLDADVFGPSVPTLFNLSGEPRLSAGVYYHLHRRSERCGPMKVNAMTRRKVTASYQLWGQKYVHGVLGGRRSTGHMAWPSRHESRPAAALGCRVGRTRRSRN